jgi:hypothetical protein
MPQFSLIIQDANSSTVEAIVPLTIINNYLLDIQKYNAGSTKQQKFTLTQQFNTGVIPTGQHRFNLYWQGVPSSAQLQVVLNPSNSVASYLSVTKVNQGGDGLVMNIAENMPYGTAGIKLIDFVTSLQKKFNLVIYPNKTKPREFIVETFNDWYKRGEIKDFNRYINLDKPIAVTPANNLAVNKLNFGDTLDGDYVSQQFAKGANREFGKSYYIDTDNFFSQGTFEVKTGMASSPLVYLTGTGTSGSSNITQAGFRAGAIVSTISSNNAAAESFLQVETDYVAIAAVGVTSPVTTAYDFDPNILGYNYRSVVVGNNIVFTSVAYGTARTTSQLIKITDSGSVNLYSGSVSDFTYTITASDVSSSVLNFIAQTDARD